MRCYASTCWSQFTPPADASSCEADPFGVAASCAMLTGQSSAIPLDCANISAIAPRVACLCALACSLNPTPVLVWLFESLCVGKPEHDLQAAVLCLAASPYAELLTACRSSDAEVPCSMRANYLIHCLRAICLLYCCPITCSGASFVSTENAATSWLSCCNIAGAVSSEKSVASRKYC